MIPPATPTSAAPRSLRTLVLVTAAVLLAHLAVLHGMPLHMMSLDSSAPAPQTAQPFITRTIAAPAPASPGATTKVSAAVPSPSVLQPTMVSKPLTGEAPAPTAPTAIETVATPPPAPAEPVELAAVTPARETPEPAPGNPAALPAAQKVLHYAVPASVRLKYDVKAEVKGITLSANGELLWVQDGKNYDARLEINMFLLGSRVQTSKGQLTEQGLEPMRFGDKYRSEVAAHFERDKNKVSFSANTPDVPLLPGAQDQLSVFMQLAGILAGSPERFPPGTSIPFQTIGPRSSEWWVFKVEEMETLRLPGGELLAIKLSRDPTGEYDPKAEVWLAPDLAYLPVRIRLSQSNGDVVDQQWKSTQTP